MDQRRYLQLIEQDYARMRETATRDLTAAVPHCPGWTTADLAVDGIDEILVTFLAFASRQWPEDFGDGLAGADGRAVTARTEPAVPVSRGGDQFRPLPWMPAAAADAAATTVNIATVRVSTNRRQRVIARLLSSTGNHRIFAARTPPDHEPPVRQATFRKSTVAR
ncbi:hypothetical protein ACIHFD_31395 [Nonomuraea sp. NPDC051941]|uniref:hypothetical protein n=1 Tax=Nonomuraea sp. NPDC051941 TaxID=3364373 RepID=UPI0037C89A72